MEVPKRNTTDPSLNPEHLKPNGKKKGWRVDKQAQLDRLDQHIQDHANDILSENNISSQEPKKKKYWWEED